MTTFLVTGGAGFIGSHLCQALVLRGDGVRVLDDLSTGTRMNVPRAARLIVGDVADPEVIARAMTGVDGCFHLAAIASVEKGVTDWLGTHRANVTGTVAVFDAIRRQDSRIPVVYASSAAVYGDCRMSPTPESADSAPLSAYGADKRGSELHARVASHVHHIPTTGLRFFNAYGPGQDPHSAYSGVISVFCDRIAAGAPIDIHGDGMQTRDFVYITDVVAGLLAAMALKPANAPVFNICTGVPTSVMALAHLIAEMCGKPLQVLGRPPRAGEIRHSLGGPALADATLRLPARLLLRDGVASVLAWLANPNDRSRLCAPSSRPSRFRRQASSS
jgi:UDP-glucose 4-epimerase